jgi:hypothetical protein
MMLVGFFIAGPGGVLGASAKNLVSFAGRAKVRHSRSAADT